MKAPKRIYVEICEDGIFAFPEPPFEESVEYVRADIAEEKETPELEEAAEEYASDYPAYNDEQAVAKYAFKRGAEWQAKQGVTFTAAVDHYDDFYLDSCDQEAEAIKKLGLKVMDWAIVQIRKK